MAVDMLRSCSVQLAEFGVDRGTVAPIRWYLCKPGAKVFPGWNAFVSPVWEPYPDEWTKGPGVYSNNENWSRNHIPCPDGVEFHGEEEWYEKGIPSQVLANPGPHEHPSCFGIELVGEVIGVGIPSYVDDPPGVLGVGVPEFWWEFS